MKPTRRQLVALAMASMLVGVLGSKLITPSSPAAAAADTTAEITETPPVGGIHINVFHKGVKVFQDGKEVFSDDNITHTWDITAWGVDDTLSGSGWGANPDPADHNHTAFNKALPCYYTAQGAIKDDVVKLKGTMIFASGADQSGALIFEANLVTKTVRMTAPDPFMFGFRPGSSYDASLYEAVMEGTGTVERI